MEDHLGHAESFLGLLEPASSLVDLGSGGGVPGLVLAAALPVTGVVLVESQRRRAAFLRGAVETLGLTDRVAVVEARAEAVGRDPAHRAGHDAVVARSFAPPAVTAEIAAPLLRLGGVAVVSEPPGGAPERWPATGLATLGLRLDAQADEPSRVRLRKIEPTDERYPRRVGVPAKRPLW